MILLAATLLAAAGSAVAPDPKGRGVWVVDAEQDRVWLVPERGGPTPRSVGRWPEQVVVTSDGIAFVSCRQEGRIDVLDGESTFHVELPGEPRGLALDETRHRLWVGLVTARELVGIDTESLAVVDRRPLDAAPRALAVNEQGLAVLFEHGGELLIFDREPKAGMAWRVALPTFDRHKAWHGLAITEAGRDFVVVHTVVDTGLSRPATSGRYGGEALVPVMTVASIVHEGRANLATFSKGFSWRDGSTVLPLLDVTGVAWRNGLLAIASRGTGTVFAATESQFRTSLIRWAQGGAGGGLTGVAFDDEGRLVAYAAFERKLVRHSYGRELKQHAGVSLGASRVDGELRLGRALFHTSSSPKVSAAGLSCSTCHVDGREDGLVWRLETTRRQTPALSGRLTGTEPYTWVGKAATLDDSIASTVTRLGGTGLTPVERRALARYLREGMRPFSRPQGSADPELLAKGSALFHSDRTGCASCHPSDEAFTDGAAHDVDSYTMKELGELKVNPPRLDTPTLKAVAFTAPYFHDGSVATLDELVEKNGDRMGHTSSLTEEERKALVAYLSSL